MALECAIAFTSCAILARTVALIALDCAEAAARWAFLHGCGFRYGNV
jgi:hypothetical protein